MGVTAKLIVDRVIVTVALECCNHALKVKRILKNFYVFEKGIISAKAVRKISD